MINRVVLVGRMTRDPELRRTNTGTAVASWTLAVNRSYNSADGQEADFIPCVVWNKAAENVERYCSKGSLVGIEGRLRSRSYDDAQGRKVFVVEAVCDSVQFLDTKKESQQANRNEFYQGPAAELDKNFNSNNGFDMQEDDIQF